MLATRVIPCLLLESTALVKTVRFRRPKYIGDPINTVRIFNELEVDELLLLDIAATREHRGPDLKLLAGIASECFMPLAYGGGLRTIDDVDKLLSTGLEKVAINSSALDDPGFITRAAGRFGSQAIIASMDVRRTMFGEPRVWSNGGTRRTGVDAVEWAREVERRGAGEILLTSIDREGTWRGFDVDLVRAVADAVSVPVIAHGGAGSVEHIEDVTRHGHASAVGLGSMVVYQGRDRGVLVNFPDRLQLAAALARS